MYPSYSMQPVNVPEEVVRVCNFLSCLEKLAFMRADADVTIPIIRRSLQNYLHGTMTPHDFVDTLQQIFGNYQPLLSSYMNIYSAMIYNVVDQGLYPSLLAVRDANQVMPRPTILAPAPSRRVSESENIPPQYLSGNESLMSNAPSEHAEYEELDDHFDAHYSPLEPVTDSAPPPITETPEPSSNVNPFLSLSSKLAARDSGESLPKVMSRPTILAPAPSRGVSESENIPPQYVPGNESLISNAPSEKVEYEEQDDHFDAHYSSLEPVIDSGPPPTTKAPEPPSHANPFLSLSSSKLQNFTITDEALNFLKEHVEAQTRIFIDECVKAAKHRIASIQPSDPSLTPTIDVKSQLAVLQALYRNQDRKKPLKKSTFSSSSVIQEDNDAALSALGQNRKRNWGTSNPEKQSSIPPAKKPSPPLRITPQDVIFVMEKDDKCGTTMAYRELIWQPPMHNK